MARENTARVAIVGTGAMGSIYAALMADAGHEVCAVDSWAEHVEAMRSKGLRVEGASGDRTVRLDATTSAADIGTADLVVIATKIDGVRAAAEAVKPIVRDDTGVLCVQNGLGGPDLAAEVLGAERITVGVIGGFGASMRGPGHAHHNGMAYLHIGEYRGGRSPRTDRIAEIWRSSGFNVQAVDDIHRSVWEKLICNCTFSGPSAITGLTVGEIMENDDAWWIASWCAVEAFQVSQGIGVELEIDDPIAFVRAFGAKIPGSVPSLAQDHAARRRGEIDAINGAIVREAEAFRLSVPTNTFVTRLIKAREAGF